jgi:hypothetical protein
VVVLKGEAWVRVSPDGEVGSLPALSRLGGGGTECDVKRRSNGVWVKCTRSGWRSGDGRKGGIPGGCSGSLSPDGRSVTGLSRDHKTCALEAIAKGGRRGKVSYGEKFDNHRWSSNDSRYVTALNEKTHRMMVVNVRTGRHVDLGRKGAYGGDFTVIKANKGKAVGKAP